MTAAPKEFGRRVALNARSRRRELDLTQAEVADAMATLGHGWVQATVSEVERGGRNLTVDELHDLASVLRLNFLELTNLHRTRRVIVTGMGRELSAKGSP